MVQYPIIHLVSNFQKLALCFTNMFSTLKLFLKDLSNNPERYQVQLIPFSTRQFAGTKRSQWHTTSLVLLIILLSL